MTHPVGQKPAVGADPAGKDPAGKRRRRFRIFGAALAVVGLGAAVSWLLTRNYETTDDAFIEGNVVKIAPQVSGVVTALHFSDNQLVEAGQPLLEIDPRDYEVQVAAAQASLDVAAAARQAAAADLELTRATTGAAVDEARHAVEQAEHLVSEARQQADAARADAERAAVDVKRYQELLQSGIASKQRQEQAEADGRSTGARWRAAGLAVTAAEAQAARSQARLQDALAVPQRIALKQAQLANADAQVEQAQAALRAAQLNLSYTRIAAPQAGRIAKRAVNAGDLVQKNQTLTELVLDPPWIVANFKETQLTRMRPGQPVAIRVDAFPGHPFQGRVESIQPGTGARFSLLPPENATGNYVKVVQRVPVKIVLDNIADAMVRQLAPGMSVVPNVDIGFLPDPKK